MQVVNNDGVHRLRTKCGKSVLASGLHLVKVYIKLLSSSVLVDCHWILLVCWKFRCKIFLLLRLWRQVMGFHGGGRVSFKATYKGPDTEGSYILIPSVEGTPF